MAYDDVERLLFQGEPSDIWLAQINAEDIVEYLGRKPPTEYHPDVIPLICRYPFEDPEHRVFVCQRFHKLLIYLDRYLYEYRERVDILIFIAGFMEGADFSDAIPQLIFHRNLLLKNGQQNSSEVLSLNHAIDHLHRHRFRVAEL